MIVILKGTVHSKINKKYTFFPLPVVVFIHLTVGDIGHSCRDVCPLSSMMGLNGTRLVVLVQLKNSKSQPGYFLCGQKLVLVNSKVVPVDSIAERK